MAIARVCIGLALLVVRLGLLTERLHAEDAAEKKPAAGEFASEKLIVGKETREYRLYVPKSIDLSKPAPLVIAFHGMLIDSKDLMPRYSGLNATASKHQCVMVYPQAIDRSWGLAPEKVQRDLSFFDALVGKLSKDYRIDPRRIYVVGISNGGYFAHVVGKERSKVVAAVASHSGPLGLQTLLGIRAERKFPVLIIHGDQDRIFSVEIARENRDKYQKEGHEVQYEEVAGHGHLWASQVNVNETLWKFFAAHPLPTVPGRAKP